MPCGKPGMRRALEGGGLSVLLWSGFSLGAISLGATSPPKQSLKGPLIWQGQSAGTSLLWTEQELGFQTESGFHSLFEPWYETEADDSGQTCEEEQSLALLSVVGPFVSWQSEKYWNCIPSAHPGDYTRFSSLDLRHPERPLLLTDIFPDQVVLQALLQEPVIRQLLEQNPPSKLPTTSVELVQLLQQKYNGECLYSFDQDLLRRFAFHHLVPQSDGGSRVAVRLGLSHGCEVARGHLTQLGFYLPIPAQWQQAFQDAVTRQTLMGSLQRHFGKRVAQQHYEDPGYAAAWQRLTGSDDTP